METLLRTTRVIALPASVTLSAFPIGAAHYRLGMLAERDGRIDEARHLYEQATELDPRNSTFKSALEHLPRPR